MHTKATFDVSIEEIWNVFCLGEDAKVLTREIVSLAGLGVGGNYEYL